jgi:alcohol dehydrogenase YqhD (iron-dependent ADH family)
MVVICTMASTGSEMDAGAVITNEHTHQKGGAFRGDLFYANVSILDPKFTYSVPKRHVAAGAADIFIHTSETYFDPATDIDLVDGFAEAIMKTVAKYTPIALAEPENFEARANLMWAAPWAINGLLSGGRMSGWTLHGLQHPIGAYHDIIHGQGLAILMPHWMRHILSDKTVDRFVRYGVNVFGIDPSLDKYEIANKAIEATEDLFFNKMGIPRTLSEIGVTDEHFDDMATQATARGGMYVPLTKEEVIEIYKAAL